MQRNGYNPCGQNGTTPPTCHPDRVKRAEGSTQVANFTLCWFILQRGGFLRSADATVGMTYVFALVGTNSNVQRIWRQIAAPPLAGLASPYGRGGRAQARTERVYVEHTNTLSFKNTVRPSQSRLRRDCSPIGRAKGWGWFRLSTQKRSKIPPVFGPGGSWVLAFTAPVVSTGRCCRRRSCRFPGRG